jgi:hypothetical protein
LVFIKYFQCAISLNKLEFSFFSMANPYDLSDGVKGYKALALMAKKSLYRSSARHLRSSYAHSDPMGIDATNARKTASELERKADKLEKKLKRN